MNRRTLLRTLAGAVAGAALVGCARGSPATGTAASDPPGTVGGLPPSDPMRQVTDLPPTLSVVSATWEQLVGAQVPLAFAVLDIDGAPVSFEAVEATVVGPDGSPGEPVTAAIVDDPTGRGGLYTAALDLTEPGAATLVVVTPDQRAGSAIVPVTTAAASELPAPGDAAPVVATPTEQDRLGAARVCTADPPCGMHDVSLDAALAEGLPVVLMFATPAYCQTVVCGPSVEVLESVRAAQDTGDVVFVHCEIYADEGQTLLQPVEDFGLPSEPWLYAIDRQGTIAARADGAIVTLPDEVGRIVGTVAA